MGLSQFIGVYFNYFGVECIFFSFGVYFNYFGGFKGILVFLVVFGYFRVG